MSTIGLVANDPVLSFVVDEIITVGTVAVATAVLLMALKRAISQHTKLVMTANIEAPDRPFTVSFSPDFPGGRCAYRVDAWVKTDPIQEALFFNPTTQRWQSQGLAYGIGTAFVENTLVSFRAVPTSAGPELIAALQRVAETRTIDQSLMNQLVDMDPNEVFSIIESIGVVREFNQALEARSPSQSDNPLRLAFGQRRALDLD